MEFNEQQHCLRLRLFVLRDRYQNLLNVGQTAEARACIRLARYLRKKLTELDSRTQPLVH
jgi:hypothetical protein